MREKLLRIDGLDIQLLEDGAREGPGVLFLHGWPQDSNAFRPVMQQLRERFRVAAMDLPGIGRSRGHPPRGDKRTLAGHVHSVVRTAGLGPVSLVGHDIGGQIVYAFLRAFPGVAARAVILNVVIPGVAPWSEVIRNPRLWHFGFHAVPQLPELLVAGHQRRYFDFFFDAIAADPARISTDSRAAYAAAYLRADSLRAGFDWYRAFAQDEQDNLRSAGTPVTTPVLYVRGDAEAGTPEAYLNGLRTAGVTHLEGAVIGHCGHFSLDEQPQALAHVLQDFLGR